MVIQQPQSQVHGTTAIVCHSIREQLLTPAAGGRFVRPDSPSKCSEDESINKQQQRAVSQIDATSLCRSLRCYPLCNVAMPVSMKLDVRGVTGSQSQMPTLRYIVFFCTASGQINRQQVLQVWRHAVNMALPRCIPIAIRVRFEYDTISHNILRGAYEELCAFEQ